MTTDERDELVTLLLCAADIAMHGDRGSALGIAAKHVLEVSYTVPALRSLGWTDAHWVKLLRGYGPVRESERDLSHRICGPGYEWLLLEAAARVEEGSWP